MITFFSTIITLYGICELVTKFFNTWLFKIIIGLFKHPTKTAKDYPWPTRIILGYLIIIILICGFFMYKADHAIKVAQDNTAKCIKNSESKLDNLENKYTSEIIECSKAQQAATDLEIFCASKLKNKISR
jgi:hypothetical protein